jgi:hypothetical protein
MELAKPLDTLLGTAIVDTKDCMKYPLGAGRFKRIESCTSIVCMNITKIVPVPEAYEF